MRKSSELYGKIYSVEIKKIEKLLKNLLKGKNPRSLYEPCSYILNAGGKRLRPFLVMISAKTTGGKLKDAYNAAAAVEILHNFTLVHDDIMDNSDKRRGRETLHKKYDVNTAILAGDSLIALAYESLLKDCRRNCNSIISTFTYGIVEVCEGQSLDKEFELRSNVSLKEYKTMIYKKTAALLEICCSIGAQLAGASNKEIQAAANYGKYIGLAFQIQDDLLDLIAQEEKFGKKIGSDLIEGKKTFLFLTAFKKAKGNDLELLKRVINNKGVLPEEVENYRQLYDRLNVFNEARKEIKRYTNLALKNLAPLKNEEGKQIMNWLANTLIDRNK